MPRIPIDLHGDDNPHSRKARRGCLRIMTTTLGMCWPCFLSTEFNYRGLELQRKLDVYKESFERTYSARHRKYFDYTGRLKKEHICLGKPTPPSKAVPTKKRVRTTKRARACKATATKSRSRTTRGSRRRGR